MKLIVQSVIGVLLLSAAAFAQSEGGGRLTGTWDTVVTIRNCVTGAPITSFQSVGSFNQGGTFSGITSGMPPTARTSERGTWRHVRANEYRFRFKAYLYNPAAQAIGYQLVTQDVDLHVDSLTWSSTGISKTYTLDGVEIGTGCSTATATRMELD